MNIIVNVLVYFLHSVKACTGFFALLFCFVVIIIANNFFFFFFFLLKLALPFCYITKFFKSNICS